MSGVQWSAATFALRLPFTANGDLSITIDTMAPRRALALSLHEAVAPPPQPYSIMPVDSFLPPEPRTT